MRSSTARHVLTAMFLLGTAAPTIVHCIPTSDAPAIHLTRRASYGGDLAPIIENNSKEKKAEDKYPLSKDFPKDWEVEDDEVKEEQSTLDLIKRVTGLKIDAKETFYEVNVNNGYLNRMCPKHGLFIAADNDHARAERYGEEAIHWDKVAAQSYHTMSLKSSDASPIKWIMQEKINNGKTVDAMDDALGPRTKDLVIKAFPRNKKEFTHNMEQPNEKGIAHLLVDFPKTMKYQNIEEIYMVARFDGSRPVKNAAAMREERLTDEEIAKEIKKNKTELMKKKESWEWHLFLKLTLA